MDTPHLVFNSIFLQYQTCYVEKEREFNGKTCPFFIKKSVMIIDFWVLSDQLVDGPKNGAWTTDRIAPRRTWRIVKYLRWICRSHHYTGETNEGTRQHRNDHFSYIIPRRGRPNSRVHFSKTQRFLETDFIREINVHFVESRLFVTIFFRENNSYF